MSAGTPCTSRPASTPSLTQSTSHVFFDIKEDVASHFAGMHRTGPCARTPTFAPDHQALLYLLIRGHVLVAPGAIDVNAHLGWLDRSSSNMTDLCQTLLADVQTCSSSST